MPVALSLRLPHHLARVLVLSEPDEPRVAQMMPSGPLQKLNFRYRFRLQPQCRMPDYAAWVL